MICRLRWHLHELDPGWEPRARALDRASGLDRSSGRLADRRDWSPGWPATSPSRCRRTHRRDQAARGGDRRPGPKLAPTLLAIPGCGALTAAKIIGETAGVDRFKSSDAYARHNGTAPLPVWSSNKARHRLSRTGNRQLNAALHRIAMTQARWHPPAKAMIERRRAGGNSGREATARPQTPPLRRRLPSATNRPNSSRSALAA